MELPGVFNLAENLENYTVNGWHIKSKIPNKPSTGGNFSVGYIVENEVGIKGFLKALDYSKAMFSPTAARDLQAMTTAYNFERQLLEKCNTHRLRYVVRIIDAGHFSLSQSEYPNGIVLATELDYLVLEQADTSARTMVDLSQTFDYAWALHSLHNVAVGINEMHNIQIAHQDIKPSNILIFNSQNTSKLGDVGRSSSLNMPASHDDCRWVGDFNYSPFEQLYGENHSDWRTRRFSCDMFMFGNLIMTYFNNVSITTAVLNKLPANMHPKYWTDSYQAILPPIQKAFAECIEQFNKNIDDELRTELMLMIQQMCNPDMSMRGRLMNSHLGTQQYSLEYYISRLDYWTKKYEYKLKQVIR